MVGIVGGEAEEEEEEEVVGLEEVLGGVGGEGDSE